MQSSDSLKSTSGTPSQQWGLKSSIPQEAEVCEPHSYSNTKYSPTSKQINRKPHIKGLYSLSSYYLVHDVQLSANYYEACQKPRNTTCRDKAGMRNRLRYDTAVGTVRARWSCFTRAWHHQSSPEIYGATHPDSCLKHQ